MKNKIFGTLLAVVALFAVAGVSAAQASEATCPAKTRCAVGTEVTKTGKNVTFKSNVFGPFTCERLDLKSKITRNDGTTIEAKGENSQPTQAGCKIGSGPFTVTSVNITNLSSKVSGQTTLSFVAGLDIGELKCTLTGTNVAGTYTPGTDILKWNEATGVTSSPSSCGTFKFSGEFTVERTSDKTPVILD